MEGVHFEDIGIDGRVILSGSSLGMWPLGRLGMKWEKYILMCFEGEYFRIVGGWN
jgi:hypothetical protein